MTEVETRAQSVGRASKTGIAPPPVALITDGDELLRLRVQEALRPEGIRVEPVADGHAALEAFSRLRPDIVLLDRTMPGMDGFACCRAIRALPAGAHVPVLILTAHEDDASIDDAYEAGATDFISKPVSWKLLSHRLRYLLRGSRMTERLARNEAALAYAQRIAQLGNWEWRADSDYVYWSDELYRLLGLEPGGPVGMESFLHGVPAEEHEAVRDCMRRLLRAPGRQRVEHRVQMPDGSERVVYHEVESVYDPQCGAMMVRGIVQDVTERRQMEQRIRMLSHYDSLTGLPNRSLFKDRLAHAVTQAMRQGTLVGLIHLDLDRFKLVNDSFGHPVGDALLQDVARRLKGAVRETDVVTRLTADGFAVMVTGMTRPTDLGKVTQKVLDVFASPFHVDGHEVHLSASVGVSLFPDDGGDSMTLLRNADTAMFSAKTQGGGRIQFYAREMSQHAQERLTMETGLRRALERNEFHLVYQPKVELASGRIVGVEALIRWQHPELGLVSPARFIPLAEEIGLIASISNWVLTTACAQAKHWNDTVHSELTIAVNLSPRQFRQQDVAGSVRRVLADTGLASEHLELELTENLLMQDAEGVVQTLDTLKRMGVSLALDDFGTGYSSLSYLKRFPIDRVKIDQSFIRDVTTSVDDAMIVKAIIAMAESLNMKTVAEGVETAGQASFLVDNRCQAIQGYYFSRPLPPEELTALLHASKRVRVEDLGRKPAQRTLLLVDDEENVLAALKRALRRDGYTILTATSGSQALELIAVHAVGVIVSDGRMPEMSGVEFLRRVKALYPDTVRIMLSGHTALESVTDAINEGAVYKYLTKPWADAALREHIAEAFRRHEALPKALLPGESSPAVAVR